MTTLSPHNRRVHRLARFAALALVAVVGFFSTQGEAADAQQLRVAPSDAAGRFTAPAPLAGGQTALRSSAGSVHSTGRSRLLTSRLAVVGPPPMAGPPTLVSYARPAAAAVPSPAHARGAKGRSPPPPVFI
jgi:hypothetical protein